MSKEQSKFTKKSIMDKKKKICGNCNDWDGYCYWFKTMTDYDNSCPVFEKRVEE